jgi:hypothetical protein
MGWFPVVVSGITALLLYRTGHTILMILTVVVVLIFLYWLVVLRPGRLDFWRIASKYPDEAYDFFVSEQCWKVFQEVLPDGYRSLVPKEDWTGPFRLWIPKLRNKMIYIFGKYPDFERAQKEFIAKMRARR